MDAGIFFKGSPPGGGRGSGGWVCWTLIPPGGIGGMRELRSLRIVSGLTTPRSSDIAAWHFQDQLACHVGQLPFGPPPPGFKQKFLDGCFLTTPQVLKKIPLVWAALGCGHTIA